ncbi:MAG: beta-glucosidase BglX, partial [Ferruginibacter sp.]|nr:beta-glucosidase BglX [Ferruginibacter sp.]
MSKDVELNIKKGLVGGVFNTFTPIAVKKLQEIAIKETRMKIPLLMGYDVIHGHRTIFPIPLGLSSSWDTDLIKKTARAAALEASADGLNWVFSPMVDIARDPRWGRVSEGAGEDTYLGSAISKAMVDGYQNGDMANNNSVMACIKHFALYGAAESGRDYNTTDMSLNRMYNEYLPPYKAGIDAGAGSLMSSFNAINGVPATGSYWLMTDLLRKQWGFKGLVATDYTAINEMVNHGVGDEEEVTRLAITAPVQMDMVGELFLKKLPDLVKSGKVNEKLIDDACRLVLESKYKLGLFKDPYRGISEKKAKTEIMSADKLHLAKESAIKSMVLLKNEKQLLPLNLNQKIAFIGPFVKDKRNLLGNWSGAGDWKKAISIWESLSKRLDSSKILYAKGCNMVDEPSLIAKLNPHDAQLTLDKKSPKELIEEAKLIAAKADVLVVCLGETFGMSGEAASLSDIRLLENQRNLLIELKKIGKPIVLVLTNGRPLELSWEANNVDAILETWISGTMAGEAICDVLFGNANPSGKLSMTFPRSVGQIPIYY